MMPPRRHRSQRTITSNIQARENAENSTPMIYHRIETPPESPSLSTSEEEPEPIAKTARRAVDISKLTYPLSISIFIDKERVSSHSRLYILDEYSFFLEKRKLDKAMKEETKKRGLKLKMKSSIGSHSYRRRSYSSLSSWLRSLAISFNVQKSSFFMISCVFFAFN